MTYIDVFRMFIIDQSDYGMGQPASEDDIAAFEQQHNVQLPEDMKEYFLKINGVNCDIHEFTGSYLYDLRTWDLYTEEKKKWNFPLTDGVPDNYFILGHFEDGAYVKWFALLNPTAQPETPIYAHLEGETTITKVADSFTEFIVAFGDPQDRQRLGL